MSDDLYLALLPLLAVSGGWLVALSTPWGKRGWWHKEWTEGGDGWERYEVPATTCPRISAAFLAEERRSMGPLWFASEYLCQFCDTDNQLYATDLVLAAVRADLAPLTFPTSASKEQLT